MCKRRRIWFGTLSLALWLAGIARPFKEAAAAVVLAELLDDLNAGSCSSSVSERQRSMVMTSFLPAAAEEDTAVLLPLDEFMLGKCNSIADMSPSWAE